MLIQKKSQDMKQSAVTHSLWKPKDVEALPGLIKSERPKSITFIGASSSFVVKRKFCQAVKMKRVTGKRLGWEPNMQNKTTCGWDLHYYSIPMQESSEVEILNFVPLALDHDAQHLEDDNRQQHLKFAQQ